MLKADKVISYIDDNCIITKEGEYYKRCISDKGHNTIECSYTVDDGKDYHYQSFIDNGNYRQHTVAKVSKEELNCTQKEKLLKEVI